MPYFNAPVYLENKEQIGKVDEIFGQLRDFYFSVKLSENMKASSFKKLQKMSVIMILMFLVAWSPYSIVCLWASFGDPKKIPPSMAIIAPLFAKSSTFYNPCIYVVANRKFRKAMFAMFKCQTHQAMPVTSILPMDISQNPLAPGRN